MLVAGVAAGAVSGGSRVAGSSIGSGGGNGGRSRLRRVRDGGGSPCRVGDDAGAAVLVEGAHRNVEVASAGAAAEPGSEQFGSLVGHLGVDDGTTAPPAGLEEGIFAALPVAFDGAGESGAGEVEGGHDVGLGDVGNEVQLGGAQQHGAAVVGGVAIEGFEVEEVVGDAGAGLHGVTVADGSGVRKGEREGKDHGSAPYMYHTILSDKWIDVKGETAEKARKWGSFEEFGGYRGRRSAYHVRESELEAKSGLSGPVACGAHRATPNHVSCRLSTENER